MLASKLYSYPTLTRRGLGTFNSLFCPSWCRCYRKFTTKNWESDRRHTANVTATRKRSDSWPPTVNLAFMPLWNSCRIVRKAGGQPNFLTICHSSSLLTVSSAFVRLMKARYRSRLCSRHFYCSFVELLHITTCIKNIYCLVFFLYQTTKKCSLLNNQHHIELLVTK